MTRLEYAVDHTPQPKATVDETDDFYIIVDSVATREGVFNRSLRRWDDLRASGSFLNGVPIGLQHPPDDDVHKGMLYVYPGEVHGFVDNVRIDDENKRILYDAYLLKSTDVPGYETTQDVVELNRELAAAVEAGQRIENSFGYLTRVERTSGEFDGEEYDEIRRDFMPYHMAVVPRGACNWRDGCGLGAATDDDDDSSHNPDPHQEGTNVTNKNNDDGNPNGDPQGERDCAHGGSPSAGFDQDKFQEFFQDALSTELEPLKERLDDLEQERKKDQERKLEEKREELAELRGLDEEETEALDAYTLQALEDAIQREKHLQAKADTTGFGGGSGGGTVREDELGATVGVYDLDEGNWSQDAPGVN